MTQETLNKANNLSNKIFRYKHLLKNAKRFEWSYDDIAGNISREQIPSELTQDIIQLIKDKLEKYKEEFEKL